MCYCPTPTLRLNLALTGDGAFLFSLKKTHSVWFISVLNYGDTENVLINHLLLVIPMSYPCYYTNLCPHKPHKHAHTHTHTHTEQWAAIYAAAPVEQLGVRCLAQKMLRFVMFPLVSLILSMLTLTTGLLQWHVWLWSPAHCIYLIANNVVFTTN